MLQKQPLLLLTVKEYGLEVIRISAQVRYLGSLKCDEYCSVTCFVWLEPLYRPNVHPLSKFQ